MCKKFLKILCVFFVLPMFVMSGCENEEKQDYSIRTDFSADFEATYRNGEYKGKLSSNRQGVLTIDITYPQTIEGLSVRYYSGEMHLARENIDSSADEAYLPAQSFPRVVKSVFDGINSDKSTIVSISEEECERNLNTTMGNAVIITGENIVRQIRIEEIDFFISFSNINLSE